MTQADSNAPNPHGNQGDVVLFSDDFLEFLDDQVDDLLHLSKARCVMVIDRSGCILSSAGDFSPISHDNMGAMAAGVIAALNAMVARASSPEVSVKFYGGEIDKVHFLVLADRLILCMMHNRHAVGTQIRHAAKEFSNTVAPRIEKEREEKSGTGSNDLLKSVNYIESKLNELFFEST